jgi:uncharacterized PurR-regulated membrane protein YhhQ (DUF165 family)
MSIKSFLSLPMLLYIGSVVLVNVLFSVVPMIETPIGLVSPVAMIVGFTFILRDFAQRKSGHSVLVAMAIATVLSYFLANPFVATASAIAFATAEIADYLIYTFSKTSFRGRILLSSLISAPVDTVVFLWLIDAFTPGTVALMIIAKLIAVAIVWNLPQTADASPVRRYAL